MEFHSETTLGAPRARVFSAFRDEVEALAPWLDGVASIRVDAARDVGPVRELWSTWSCRPAIPPVLRAVVGPDAVELVEAASWDAGTRQCALSLSTPRFPDAIRCEATRVFVEDAAGTRVIVTGRLEVSFRGRSGATSFLAKRVEPQLDKLFLDLIPPLLTRAPAALDAHLKRGTP